MWTLESFRTLDLLVTYLNDRKLPASQCKVVAGIGEDGDPIYHLLYQADVDGSGRHRREAAVEAGLLSVSATDGGDAVNRAEQIIQDAQREE